MFHHGISTTLSRSAVATTQTSPRSSPPSSVTKSRGFCGDGEPYSKRRTIAPLAGVFCGICSVDGTDGGGCRRGMDRDRSNLGIHE